MKKIAWLLLFAVSTELLAAPLTSYPNLPASMRSQISNDGLFLKGIADTNWYALEVDPATGALPVTISGSIPVSGTVTANQGTGGVSAWKVDGSAVTQPVSGTFWQATQPVSISGTVPVSGTVTANAGTGTFAVSAASLPLPTGAATAANQPALGTAGAASTDVLTVQGIASMTPLLVNGSGSTQPVSGTVTANAGSGTFAISASSLPLPAGAATSALQSTGNTSLASIDGKTPSLGQAVMASSVPVAIASNQGNVPVTFGGRAAGILLTYDYTGGTVTTAAYTQVTASTSSAVTRLYIFDSSGSAIIIATGAAASEVNQLYLPPGGSPAPYELNVPISTRISIKALDTNASTGRLIITGLQ